ncbi:Hypothetical predicted protein [Xyrichtys novacula]|uniref:Uncharacterized protein n=1 Tax=Xyrichtys novacula TaxID=13765 RepID=A0AAV1FRK1_XYRNO|nr:Hypothetical predicted protein [Xyrichtys novacula]
MEKYGNLQLIKSSFLSRRHTPAPPPATQAASPPLPPPDQTPHQTGATDLLTHTQPYGPAGTRHHTVIRGMVPDTWLCCSSRLRSTSPQITMPSSENLTGGQWTRAKGKQQALKSADKWKPC